MFLVNKNGNYDNFKRNIHYVDVHPKFRNNNIYVRSIFCRIILSEYSLNFELVWINPEKIISVHTIEIIYLDMLTSFLSIKQPLNSTGKVYDRWDINSNLSFTVAKSVCPNRICISFSNIVLSWKLPLVFWSSRTTRHVTCEELPPQVEKIPSFIFSL